MKSNEFRTQEVAEGHRGGSLDIETGWMQEVVEGHRAGILDIETRWAQEVCREARAGKYRYSNHMSAKILNPNDDACRKLCRDEGEKPRYWNPMNAGSCWEAQVCESLGILRQDACKKLRGGHGGATYETKWMEEIVEGHREEIWILKQDECKKCREARGEV